MDSTMILQGSCENSVSDRDGQWAQPDMGDVTSTAKTMGEIAASLAKNGMKIFPCGPDKKPLTAHGFHDASCDKGTVERWWATNPDAMIGMPTGAMNDRVVLDVDIDEAAGINGPNSLMALIEQYGAIPSTFTVGTPRGGFHFHFKYPGRKIKNSTGKLGAGLDIRGDGGYVIVPPSQNAAGRAYTVEDDSPLAAMPEWVLTMLEKGNQPDSLQPGGNLQLAGDPSAYAQAALNGELAKVRSETKGCRNGTLNTSAFSLGQLVAGGLLERAEVESALFQAAIENGLVADDGEDSARTTIQSGLDAGAKSPRTAPNQGGANEPGDAPVTLNPVYYDRASKDYLTQNQRGIWYPMTEAQYRKTLQAAGIMFSTPKGKNVSPAEQIILDTRHHNDVDYVGPLAGYTTGIQNEDGKRLLITEMFSLLQPAEGDFPVLRKILEGLLVVEGIDQRPYFYGWLKLAYETLCAGKRRPGQAIVFAGPRNGGKSLIQNLITATLGGRSARPYQYMSGKTAFNADLFTGEHLIMEDEEASKDIRSRRNFATQIKAMTVNEGQRLHAKFCTPITVKPFWRLSISVNDEPEDLMVLPPIDESLADKIILLKTNAVPMPMPTTTLDERTRFWATLMAELPAFIGFLLSWDVPAELQDSRFGITHFHHPDILSDLDTLSPEFRLLSLIDSELFDSAFSEKKWSGSADELEYRLTRDESVCRHAARQVISFNNAVGVFLGRLAKKLPARFTQHRTETARTWTIQPPVGQ